MKRIILMSLCLNTLGFGKIYVVNSLGDVTNPLDGSLTLREAVLSSNLGDEINFAAALSGKTITLAQGEIVVATAVTVENTLFGLVTIKPGKLTPSRIFRVQALSWLSLSRVRLDSASSPNQGGAVWNGGQFWANSCVFEGNESDSDGGAIYNRAGVTTLRDCRLSDNVANRGGAIANVEEGVVEAFDCEFVENEATDSEGFVGGGASYSNGSETLFWSSQLIGNRGARNGLAIGTESGGGLTLQNCLVAASEEIGDDVQENQAAVGAYESRVTFSNCLVLGNNSGGFRALRGPDSLVNGCTFSGNRDTAVEILEAVSELQNCLIWHNRDDDLWRHADASMKVISEGHGAGSIKAYSSLIQGHDLTLPVERKSLDGTDWSLDPGFAEPVDFGVVPTSEGDLTPSFDSVVIDRGDTAESRGVNDALGELRMMGGGVDIGAVELQRRTLYVDASAAGNEADGVSWDTAFPTLAAGLDTALEGDVIRVAEGVYRPDEGPGRVAGDEMVYFLIDKSIDLLGGFQAGGPERDPSNHVTILSGDLGGDDDVVLGMSDRPDGIVGSNSVAVLQINGGEESEVSLHGFTIKGADARAGHIFPTGGLTVSSGSVQVAEVTLRANRRALSVRGSEFDFREGEISFNSGPDSAVRVSEASATFVNVYAMKNVRNFRFYDSVVRVENLAYLENQGRIEFLNESTATLVNSTFAGNQFTPLDVTGNSSLTVQNCIVWNNSQLTGKDASLFIHPTSSASFSNSVLEFHDLTGQGEGNFDGTDALANPCFVAPADPLDALGSFGDYHLSSISPYLRAGNLAFREETYSLDEKSNNANILGDGSTVIGAFGDIAVAADPDGDGLPLFWEKEYATGEDLEEFTPGGDLDRDGLSNELEFLLGLDPTRFNSSGDYLRLTFTTVEDDRFPMVIHRLRANLRFRDRLTLMHSSTLAEDSWSAHGFENVDLGQGAYEVAKQAILAVGESPRQFFRLTTENPPK